MTTTKKVFSLEAIDVNSSDLAYLEDMLNEHDVNFRGSRGVLDTVSITVVGFGPVKKVVVVTYDDSVDIDKYVKNYCKARLNDLYVSAMDAIEDSTLEHIY